MKVSTFAGALAFALMAAPPAVADPSSFFGQGTESAAPWTGPRGGYAPPFASEREAIVMAADTLTLVPIRTGSRIVNISLDCNVWVKLGQVGTTFTLPAATTTDGSGPALNPATRMIPPTLADASVPTHIVLRSATACNGSIEFWSGAQ